MKKSLTKFLFRKIKKNISGFITISIIVGLGVGFLVGLLNTTPDLQNSVDAYYNEYKIQDINLKSTIGFDEESINVLKENLGEESYLIESSYQIDEHIYEGENKLSSRQIYYNFDNPDMNIVEIIEGRQPMSEFEILVERESEFIRHFDIGSTLTINEQDYEIVGIAANPLYFSHEKEFTVISPGRLDAIVYLDAKYNTNDYFTDICIRVKEAENLNTFSEEYFDLIDKEIKKINEYKTSMLEHRISVLEVTIREEVKKAIYDELVNRFGEILADTLIDSENVVAQIDAYTKEQLDALHPQIYSLTRKDNTSFYIYDIQSKKTNEVAMIFPFFFIAIATLITLSTLERMIHEDRIYIGTLKSLGYKKRDISSVYLIYSLLASSLGIALGTLIGAFGLPYVVYFVFGALYNLPPLIISMNLTVFLITSIGLTAAILLATTLTLIGTLKEKPNALLTQKPIKSGGKIMLERIKFIWNKLKFKYKSTCRNIFRFKKNALMMIVGIAGSTALVVGAFGMGDSISDVTYKQYSEVILYNTLVTVENYKEDPLLKFDNVEKKDIIYMQEAVCSDKKDLDFQIIANFGDTNLNEYINFVENDKPIEFNEDSVIISYQISEMLGLNVGDVFFFEVEDKQYNCLITNVVENYVENYLYISESTFKNLFKDLYKPNCYMAVANNIETQEQQDQFITDICEDENVISVNLTYQNMATYNTVLSLLKMIIFVIVIFAGLLEVTSIYSLTNIGVSERTRELATLKVLGYRRREVVGYIYRETAILAIVGILIGLVAGYFFHAFVVVTMHFPGLSIGSVISPLSYLYGILISVVFFVLVDLIYLPKINKISMIESLKSVE